MEAQKEGSAMAMLYTLHILGSTQSTTYHEAETLFPI